jgi:hypothetical protein
MKAKFALVPLTVCAALLSSYAVAGPEAGHPNIIAAREDTQHAIEKMKAAQSANEYDLGGHAAKAEKLLHEAEHQMMLAAETANEKKGKK